MKKMFDNIRKQITVYNLFLNMLNIEAEEEKNEGRSLRLLK